jgi:tetratricopeptide (TPR) repeat protein
MAEHWDVFLSYARADAAQVHRLAENLHHAGLKVFLDEWEIAPGDILVHQLDRGILNSLNGILAVTPTALARPWVQNEYAAMMTRAVEGKQRLIAVLLADTDMPPLLASRVYVDLRRADGPEYERETSKLISFLKGERLGPPPRTGEFLPRPDTAVVREPVISRRLRIGREKVVLFDQDTVEAEHRPKGLSFRTEHELVWNLERLRHGYLTEDAQLYRASRGAAAPARESKQHTLLLQIGAALGEEMLAGAAGEALGRALEEAKRLGVPLELALEPEDDLASFPWEALRLPGPGGLPSEPLALYPNVLLFRAVTGLGPTPHRPVPGPLRILVVIGSPEEQNERGELLNMEKELSRILEAVEPARKQSRPAHVRVLERGTLKAIREALAAERYHALHVTCHAGPGVLVLESEEGGEDKVDAGRFCNEALVPGRGVPVVVLAGCATALSIPGKNQGEAALPGFARELLARGVPAVVAMQAPVSDSYATELGARFYHTLAISKRPDPLFALVEARRSVETDRQKGQLVGPVDLAEWATPALWLRGPSLPLYDPDLPFEEIQPSPEPHLSDRVVVRPVGEFVGRRREKRQILHALGRADRAGVVLHGLGGVGKSSLSAEVLRKLQEERWLVASVHGEVAPDDLLAEVGRCYLASFQQEGTVEADPRRQLAVFLGQPDRDWEERFDLLSRNLLGDRPVILLLDNFEDNLVDGGLGSTVKNEDLADLLARWVRNPGRSRLLFTSRLPFELPDRGHRRLEALHLGPLSFAETRKLIWRLPGLDTLQREEQLRAYTDVGGHPRALEYLDVLLRGGESRFPDIAERLEMALEKKGVRHPEAWLRRAKGDLDQALAEAVTLAVDDVLLDRLLEKLESVPLAKELLLGASVYRIPVDLIGLAWQVSEEIDIAEDRERRERMEALCHEFGRVLVRGEEPSPELLTKLQAELPEWQRPPLVEPRNFPVALERLGDLGLLAPVDAQGDTRFAVHRWTASALLSRNPVVREAHRRAARHWRWRIDRFFQSPQDDTVQLLEARRHYYEAGDIDQAVEVTEIICSQLNAQGAYHREEQLLHEVLGWFPEGCQAAAKYMLQLAQIASLCGDFDNAQRWLEKAASIFDDAKDFESKAGIYHELGILAQKRGAYYEALDWYEKSLQTSQSLASTRSGEKPLLAEPPAGAARREAFRRVAAGAYRKRGG